MTYIRKRGIVAAVVAASCLTALATVSASAGELPPTFRTDAAQPVSQSSVPSTDRSDAAQAGPSVDYAFPPAGFRGGDTPVDHPGADRAPIMVEVVLPEHTIVRDVDEALPLVLSSTALLLVLAGTGVALVRAGMVPRVRRSS
jgi:hypothetical protein